MEKYMYLAAMTILSATAAAQPTLTGSNFNPVPGEVYTTKRVIPSNPYSANGLPGASGASANWDYSSLPFGSYTSNDSIKYYGCSGAPVSICDSFPGSNLVGYGYGTSYTSPIDYAYIANSDSFSILGAYMSYYTHYAPASRVMLYPFTYGTTKSQSFAGVNGTTWINYSTQSMGDAYGTLKLPNGTYNNVLRIHNTITQIDSDTYFTNHIDTIKQDNYFWYLPGFHGCLYSLTYQYFHPYYQATGFTDTIIKYTTVSTFPTEVAFLNGSQRQITVFPNPSNGRFTITLPESGEAATITVTNIMGAKLWETTTQQDKEDIQLDQPAGIYFLTVEGNGSKSVQKIIINQ